MKKKELLDERMGEFRLRLEIIEGDPGPHDYGISRQSWIRGIKLMNHYGATRALEIIDERAERAAGRGDYDTSRRWRDLITAIHAIEEDERVAGDNVH